VHSSSDPANRQQRYREVRKVTLVGSAVDFVLGVAKIVIGWFANSQALIADGIHSLSDLLTGFIVLYAAKHSHKSADEVHPYGYGRIETLATVSLGIVLTGVAIGISYEAIKRLNDPAAAMDFTSTGAADCVVIGDFERVDLSLYDVCCAAIAFGFADGQRVA
jgi:cation diffusion facilitator family transporter